VAEWFKAAVLKIAVGLHPTGGSNPSLSAIKRLRALASSLTQEVIPVQNKVLNGHKAEVALGGRG
jgi:hypothetical protein